MSVRKSARGSPPRQGGATQPVAKKEKWYIARKIVRQGDSQKALESLGLKVTDIGDDLFYEVEVPEGWTKSTEGLWTTVCDASGAKRITQFYKSASYDCEAHLTGIK
ncbi:MAG: hypothetical protein AB200_00470 [Parcubacteria bacterium C7867-005]|nr:MAG: hypothetical protein AB200_00470 [Parcubacteria bacterium C7867-005]